MVPLWSNNRCETSEHAVAALDPAEFPTIEAFGWAIKSIHARFHRRARRTLEKTSGQRSEDKPSDVG